MEHSKTESGVMLPVTDSRHLFCKESLSHMYFVLDRKRVNVCNKEIEKFSHTVSFSSLKESGKTSAQLSLILKTLHFV